MGAREGDLGRVDRCGPAERRDHGRAVGLVAVGPDADPCLLPEVDPLDFLEDAVDEMLAGLLAVGDDVDPGLGLVEQGEAPGVALGLLEPRGILGGPRRPELFLRSEERRVGTACVCTWRSRWATSH